MNNWKYVLPKHHLSQIFTIYISCCIKKILYIGIIILLWCSEKAPELVNWILFTGEEQSKKSFSLDADGQTSSQNSEKSHQDAHCQVPVVYVETGTDKIESVRDKGLLEMNLESSLKLDQSTFLQIYHSIFRNSWILLLKQPTSKTYNVTWPKL